ncbi:nicotinamide riboside kinase 1 [Nannizzia gypsea CBS 118893]|uniref:Nicotinamide riboside kinase 1 n=1 Tax=Arthroderma gypseum (strain ATCC MYA-4604 / CBS 118893) TaxID=535722 RepID=E4V1F8_ARTGP|nr:nicotinamide riboside kinase 1 [Nannizzia gypsea CBS 118893]EFR03873.1 nicotinamide riboside kinase 1 [Nannizzia gypsea CBS 118893]
MAARKIFVVGISGPSSSGKTTLARLLRTVFTPKQESNGDIKTYLVHEDDFYKADNQIPITTTSSGKLVQDWDTVEAFDIKQFVSCLSHIRETGGFPPKLKSKEDLNDATDSGVDEATIHALQGRIAQQLQQHLASQQQRTEGLDPSLTIVFVDGFLLYAPSNDSTHPLRHVHDQINLPIFLPVTYPLLKERREGRTGYVTIGPAPTPVFREEDNSQDKSADDGAEDGNGKDGAPVNFWIDPPGYVDDIVWPRYISNCSWLLLPDSASASKMDLDKMKELIGDGSFVREDLGIAVAPGKGEAPMHQLLDWAADLIFAKIEEIKTEK